LDANLSEDVEGGFWKRVEDSRPRTFEVVVGLVKGTFAHLVQELLVELSGSLVYVGACGGKNGIIWLIRARYAWKVGLVPGSERAYISRYKIIGTVLISVGSVANDPPCDDEIKELFMNRAR
jgi:hypothetical protein